MRNFWIEVFQNKALWVTLLAWFIAQGAKVILGTIRERRFNFYWLLGTGGMPSSHSAAVVALMFCIGYEAGFSSPFFAFATIFALITMFDAQTWRRSIGFQARVLNRMLDDLHKHKRIQEKQLRELVGHTPIEVFVGAVIGVVVTVIFYNL